jgi:lysophospholipase L1-like esterase
MFLRRLILTLLGLAAVSTTPAAPEKWAAAIDKFVQADRATPPARDGIVFVGSSSIVKWASLKQDFPGLNVLNRGFGGSELADSAYYAERLVVPLHPSIVVVYAGDNDLSLGKTPEAVHASFREFCTTVHAALPATRIVFIAIKPSPSRWKLKDKIVTANTLIAATCKADPRLAYADVYAPMLDAAGNPRPELFVKDMLHMNEAGYAVWKPIVTALLKR